MQWPVYYTAIAWNKIINDLNESAFLLIKKKIVPMG